MTADSASRTRSRFKDSTVFRNVRTTDEGDQGKGEKSRKEERSRNILYIRLRKPIQSLTYATGRLLEFHCLKLIEVLS